MNNRQFIRIGCRADCIRCSDDVRLIHCGLNKGDGGDTIKTGNLSGSSHKGDFCNFTCINAAMAEIPTTVVQWAKIADQLICSFSNFTRITPVENETPPSKYPPPYQSKISGTPKKVENGVQEQNGRRARVEIKAPSLTRPRFSG